MPIVIRPFHRGDRDKLTALVNLHVAAVIPGVALSVNTVLGQLEREPGESIVDPWVAERRCLVAERKHEVVAAVLLHRFRSDADVAAGYRGAGDLRWIICKVDAVETGADLLAAALAQMRARQVTMVGAESALPALGCYGVPDTLPHLRGLLDDAGFGPPSRTELVLAARCDGLVGADLDGVSVSRSLGLLGTRFTLRQQVAELGFIEVCERSAETARSSTAARWADIGNLVIRDRADADTAAPLLLSVAAEWLLLGGVTRLVDYWAADIDPPEQLTRLQLAGFRVLVRNERGFQRTP